MLQEGLKLVMLFDSRKQTYCVCSHNLTAEEASRELDELRRDGLPAFTVDQRSWHDADDPEECPSCRSEVRHSARDSRTERRR
jgi:hypothetical protein